MILKRLSEIFREVSIIMTTSYASEVTFRIAGYILFRIYQIVMLQIKNLLISTIKS